MRDNRESQEDESLASLIFNCRKICREITQPNFRQLKLSVLMSRAIIYATIGSLFVQLNFNSEKDVTRIALRDA